jgi:MFS family permease
MQSFGFAESRKVVSCLIGLRRLRDFLDRQSHNYRTVLVRSAGANLLMNLTGSYTSIYTAELGADPVTLGSMNSVGSLVNTVISMPSGWFSDRYDLKRVMGIGMAVQVVMIGLYAFARDWTWILLAMAISPLTDALMFRSQTVMISDGLRDEDRASGFGLRVVLAQLIGLMVPIPAAILVQHFGGLTVEGIRPLFYMRLAGMVALYAYIYARLHGVPPQPRQERSTFLQDFREVFTGGRGLRAWIGVGCLGSLVWGIMDPFVFLYAAEVKGADALTLGVLSTVATLASILFAYPINRIADTRGRKAAIYVVRPAMYLWMLLVVLAPSPQWLVLAWVLRGIGGSSHAFEALGLELVPAGQRGRWLGITSTFSSMFRIPAPIIGGLLYEGANPGLIFLVPLALDLGVRLPLIAFKVPETLSKKVAAEQ